MEQVKSILGVGDEDNIFGILKQEHDQVKANLEQMISENAPSSNIFVQARNALNAHMRGEESLLYPILQNNAEMRPIVIASIEEHRMAKQVLNEIANTMAGGDEWVAKIRVLNDLISRHVEVEEDEVFPKAKNMLSDEQERNIREEYTKQKNLGSSPYPAQSL